MNTRTRPSLYAALIREVDERMTQALDNFFQRSRTAILDEIAHAISREPTPTAAMLAAGQTCMDWLNAQPDRLSAAFAAQFEPHRSPSDARPAEPQATDLQLLDDDQFGRQLAEDKAVAFLTEMLGPDAHAFFNRLATLYSQDASPAHPALAYGPRAVVRALSTALDALALDTASGTLLLRHATPALKDTLRHTYAALNQYLVAQDIETGAGPKPVVVPARTPRPDDAAPSVGDEILAHIRSAGATIAGPFPVPGPAIVAPALSPAPPRNGPRRNFADSLGRWQAGLPCMTEIVPDAPILVLRQLQAHAGETDADGFDLAMLDAVAGLFEFILADPDVSAGYKSEIAQLQIPTLRAALAAPVFFSDDGHPARQLIDLLGRFSRRFPERHPAHAEVLRRIGIACTHVINEPVHHADAFAQAHADLADWLAAEDANADGAMATAIADLEHIERQELGTLLALENLQDLTARYPAPQSVLRQLEAAWVPQMSALYVAEAGEGPQWRAAGETLKQLFLSLQPPADETAREACLRKLPRINAELRAGLLAQGALPEQMKTFFDAITATQECWIRPTLGRREDAVGRFVPLRAAQPDIESLAQRQAGMPAADAAERQANALQEGDWVDFDPPYEDLTTARVAWVGVQGYLLFCDATGETRFSLDSERLATEIRAGRAHIPEQSLTRKAMLRLHARLPDRAT
jgi:hypothetical protein